VDVVGHDHEGIEGHVRKVMRDLLPTLRHGLSNRTAVHLAICDLSKKTRQSWPRVQMVTKYAPDRE